MILSFDEILPFLCQPTQSCTGVENIRRRIAELNLAGSKVDFSEGSLDAQRSENNGVIVVAVGKFTPSTSSLPLPFLQTFFLSYQANNVSFKSELL